MEEYTLDSLIEMNQSVFSHASGLKKEADLLMRFGRYPHVISLCVLLKEELSKCKILRRLILAKYFEENISMDELMEFHPSHKDAHRLIQIHLFEIDLVSFEEMDQENDFIETGFFESLRENSLYTCFNFSRGFSNPRHIFKKEIAIEHLRESKILLESNLKENYANKLIVSQSKQNRKRRMFKTVERHRRRLIRKYIKGVASREVALKPNGKKFDGAPASEYEKTLTTANFYQTIQLVLENARYLIDTAKLLRGRLSTPTAVYFLSAAYEELGKLPLIFQLGVAYQLKKALPWNTFLENFFNHQAKYIRALNFEKEMGISKSDNSDAISEAQAMFWLRNASVYTSANKRFLNPRNFIYLNEELFSAAEDKWKFIDSYFNRISKCSFFERIGYDPTLVTPKPVQDSYLLTDKQKKMRIYRSLHNFK